MKGQKCYANHIILLEVTLRKRFLSCMAFSTYEVFRVACQSHSIQERNLCSPGSEGSHLPEKRAKGTPTELINEKIILIRSKFFFLFIN